MSDEDGEITKEFLITFGVSAVTPIWSMFTTANNQFFSWGVNGG